VVVLVHVTSFTRAGAQPFARPVRIVLTRTKRPGSHDRSPAAGSRDHPRRLRLTAGTTMPLVLRSPHRLMTYCAAPRADKKTQPHPRCEQKTLSIHIRPNARVIAASPYRMPESVYCQGRFPGTCGHRSSTPTVAYD